MIDTPSGISGNGGNLIKGVEMSGGGGCGPWGGTTVAVSPDIWIPVAIGLVQPVAEAANAVKWLAERSGETAMGKDVR